MPLSSRLLPAVLLALLAGCTLIDRRTFAPAPAAPSAADLAHARLPTLPLVTIRFGATEPDYGPALTTAVQDAVARKPDATFEVMTPIPSDAPPAVQAAAARQGTEDMRGVANAIAAAGVAQDHVHLGFRGDAGTPPRQVEVFVR
jgi:hypothetical protein